MGVKVKTAHPPSVVQRPVPVQPQLPATQFSTPFVPQAAPVTQQGDRGYDSNYPPLSAQTAPAQSVEWNEASSMMQNLRVNSEQHVKSASPVKYQPMQQQQSAFTQSAYQ